MPVELFNIDEDPSTTLVIAIYNDGNDIIPSWWLEMIDRDYYDIQEMQAVLDCIPGIVSRLEQFVEKFK